MPAATTTRSAAPLPDTWDTIVSAVLNHDGTGPGPMELLVGHTGDPYTGFELLQEGLRSRRARVAGEPDGLGDAR